MFDLILHFVVNEVGGYGLNLVINIDKLFLHFTCCSVTSFCML